jgi:hypothetical protein
LAKNEKIKFHEFDKNEFIIDIVKFVLSEKIAPAQTEKEQLIS